MHHDAPCLRSSLTEIDAGEPYGLRRWVRYEPQEPRWRPPELPGGRSGRAIDAHQHG